MTDHTAIQETDEMRQQWAKHIEQGAPKREWVGLTEEEKQAAYLKIDIWSVCVDFIETKLKEKNGG